jgi:hypothetical protein
MLKRRRSELLDVIPVGYAVVAQHVAVIPDALDDGGGLGGHGRASRWVVFSASNSHCKGLLRI